MSRAPVVVGNFPNPGAINVFLDALGSLGTQGSADLVIVQSGTAASSNKVDSTPAHPGIMSLATGSTATGQCHCGGALSFMPLFFGGGPHSLQIEGRVPVLSVAAQRFIAAFGFYDSVAATPTNGLWVQHFDPVNGGNWTVVATQGGVTVAILDAGIPAVANEWKNFLIQMSGDGLQGQVFIDGVLVATVTFGAWAAGVSFGANIRKTVGTTALKIEWDYLWYQHNPSSGFIR